MIRYIIWAWKEDYINLGAGAETGIMELLLTDRQGNIILDYKPEEKQWWINGFNPQKQNV